jgi:hypothetical protein
MIYIIIYEWAVPYYVAVDLATLPMSLQDVYAPFDGKLVTWSKGEITEWKPC